MLTFEGQPFQGAQAIVQKLSELPFTKLKHTVKSSDFQPTPGNGILVFVTGDLHVDDSPNPIKFAQVFHLLPTDASMANFFVYNDVFRLNYG